MARQMSTKAGRRVYTGKVEKAPAPLRSMGMKGWESGGLEPLRVNAARATLHKALLLLLLSVLPSASQHLPTLLPLPSLSLLSSCLLLHRQL